MEFSNYPSNEPPTYTKNLSLWSFCQAQISKTQFQKPDLTQAEKNKIMSTIESFCEKMEKIELELNSKGKSSGFYDC